MAREDQRGTGGTLTFDLWASNTVHFAVLSYQTYLTQNVQFFKTNKFMKVKTADVSKEIVSFPDIVEDRELSSYFYAKTQ